MGRLTPAPGRGAVLAAGAVVLTTWAALFEIRFADRWAAGPRLLLFAVLVALVGAMAAQAPMGGPVPLPYHATLQITAVILGALTLGNLADALGASGEFGGAGGTFWTMTVLAVVVLAWAHRTNSAILTLLGAGAGVIAAVSFVGWLGGSGLDAARWTLLVCALALTVGAVWLRDRARRHAVSLVDVIGLSLVALGVLTIAATAVSSIASGFASSAGGLIADHVIHTEAPHPVGWEIALLVFGFALIAYGAVDRERVPAFLGVVCLAEFAGLAGAGRHDFLGWPLVLLLLALALLAVGLRPREELPPEPPVPGVQPPPPPPPTAPTEVARP